MVPQPSSSGLAYRLGPASASGRPWVFLHGLLRQGADGAPLFADVAAQGLAIFAVDHAGHGASPRMDSYRLVDHLPRLETFLANDVGGQPAILYGHSMGAMLAAALGAAKPELVRAVILEDPPFHTMGSRLAGTALHGYFEAVRPCIGDRSLTAAKLGAVRVPVSEGKTALLAELREAAQLRYMAHCFGEADSRVLDSVLAGQWLDGYDVEKVCRGLRCPVLLLQSDPAAGGMLTGEDAAAAVNWGADVTLVRLPAGLGHQAHWQDRTEVVRHLLAFLESL